MPIRVLLVEDQPLDAEMTERELRKAQLDFVLRRVDGAAAFEAQLQEFRPDIVISDHNLPGFGGRAALQLTRQHAPGLPFILVTGSLDEETAVEYMKAGATDYILKDRLVRLGPAVQAGLERRRLEDQLRQAQKMEAVGQLAGGVAHDFNNILTAIIGYSELLLQELSDDAAPRADVAEIRKAADRAAALTRQLLAFGRKQILAPRVLDLNALIAGLDGMMRRTLGENIDIVSNLAPTLGATRADPGQMEQVIVNLAVNARDAMPDGGKLTIETSNVDLDESYAQGHLPVQPGRFVLLAVSDTGTGMSQETMAHIFEPFYTTKEKGHGTGLGLATVYGIVKQSGGFIWVYSEPNEGSTFKIYLPLVTDLVDSDEIVAAPAPQRGSETILLVEDEAGVRALARRVLEGLGYDVLEAGDSGPAALLAREFTGPIHLLITDVVLPGSGGRKLAEELAGPRPAMKVLYMSGYTENAIVHRGVLEAKAAFLHKPFTPQDLAARVRQVLDRP
ncbi:MAG TPA: response regulator [Gemmatimonadales bacterium]